MNKRKLGKILFSLGGSLLAAVIALGSYVSFAIFEASESATGDFAGKVGLRSYFQKGTGTETDPFVISRPVHFYNLTRLQNLGVFPTRVFFVLGYDPSHPNDPYGSDSATNLQFYTDNISTDLVDYLDMSSMSGDGSGYSFNSIGTEAAPFYGSFNGNYKTVKGLHIHSSPEDVGIFGYTASASKVSNVCFEDVNVTDDGYSTDVTGLSDLYGETLTTLSTAGMKFTYNGDTTTDFSTSMQTLFSYDAVASASQNDTATYSDLHNFTLTVPTLTTTGVNYTFHSSSEYLYVIDNNNGTCTVSINRGKDNTTDYPYYHSVENNTDFFSASGYVINTRVSLVVSIFKNGFAYSKILGTYKLSFTSSVGESVNSVTVKGGIDYVNTVASGTEGYVENATEYAHGVNIGYVIGHCDGSVSSVYVHNGTLNMNTTTTGVVNLAQETETGLVGEVGISLANEFTPESSYDTAGDTGVVNFSKIYSDIAGDTTFTHVTSGANYYTYTPTNLSTNKFAKYLRTDGSTANDSWGNAVTNAENSIDFGGKMLIQDETSVNRNLGVFKMMSSNHDTSSYPASQFNLGLGEFNVSKQTTPFTEFYYTTAEYADTTASTEVGNQWGIEDSKNSHMFLGTHMPSYGDDYTWNPTMEKYWNFIVRCPLSSDANNDYFFNSGGFMKSYWSYKLVGKGGGKVEPNSKNFGIFVKDVDMEQNKITNISSFDSSLKLTTANGSFPYTTVDEMTYPYNSIDFSITAENGANVTVMASSANGTSGFVSIFDKSKGYSNKTRKPSYTMYLPYTNDADSFAFFNYDYGSGKYGTLDTDGLNTGDGRATWSTCGEKLFAHTFKLPKGDYFITTPTYDGNSRNVKIYYVCAQGQEQNGNYGNEVNAYSNLNVIDKMDFVYSIPTKANYVAGSGTWRCYLSFKSGFSSASGSVSVSTDSTHLTATLSRSANLTSAIILNEKGNAFTFGDTDYTGVRYIVV